MQLRTAKKKWASKLRCGAAPTRHAVLLCLRVWGPTTQRFPTSLRACLLDTQVLEPGSSDRKPQHTDIVHCHYTGRLEDGTVFDSSVERGKPLTFLIGIGAVIRGWDEVRPGAANLCAPTEAYSCGRGPSKPATPRAHSGRPKPFNIPGRRASAPGGLGSGTVAGICVLLGGRHIRGSARGTKGCPHPLWTVG